jgi:uncharacterized membrane protein YcfT
MAQSEVASVSPRDKRVAFVDYAKGVCIILVVTMHSTLGTGQAMGGEGFMHSLVAFAKPFRMPDFFLIAGLFAAQSFARDWRTFLDRKLLHFAYFYLLWAFIQCVLKSYGAPEGVFAHFIGTFAFSLIEPFGTLWFIYLLPIFFVTTRLLRNEHPLVVLLFAATLETLRIDTGWTVVDEFARRYVYFYSGYLFAPLVFDFAAAVTRRKARAVAGLALWAVVNGLAVKLPGLWWPSVSVMPLVSLVLGYAGALAIVAISALLAQAHRTALLGWLGSRSIVVYLAFFLPMAATRTLIVKSGLLSDVGIASLVVTGVSIVVPLLIARAVWGTKLTFLFERPAFLKLESKSPSSKSPSADATVMVAARVSDGEIRRSRAQTNFYP